jgi:hypothetical protein
MANGPFKRKKVLVDPEFQLGLSTEMVGWIYVYFLLFSVVANSGSIWDVASSRPDDAAYVAAMDQLRSFASYVVLPMGVTFVAMGIHGIYVTHRIAGPIVRLKRTMREIAARKSPEPIVLRKKDYFKDLADEINAATSVMREDAIRRTRITEETLAHARAAVRALEERPQNAREALALANSTLDGLETLSRYLKATHEPGADGGAVPLPEADLPPAATGDDDASAGGGDAAGDRVPVLAAHSAADAAK